MEQQGRETIMLLRSVVKPLSGRFFATMTATPQIKTAAILVIGDEILNGKIKDTNSQYFADYCFDLGIDLRRIAVVPDETEDIVEVLNSLRKTADFIVTTGGIGSTHDDITYESIAKAFELPLKMDEETVNKMNQLSQFPPREKSGHALEAQLRMAQFPAGSNVEQLFVNDNLWVPIVALNQQVYIFPGIPSLFRELMEALKPQISPRVDAPKMIRRFISTRVPESKMAPILSDIHLQFKDRGVKIGSYPHVRDQRNTVSVLGPAEESDLLESIVNELIPEINGKELTAQEEAASV